MWRTSELGGEANKSSGLWVWWWGEERLRRRCWGKPSHMPPLLPWMEDDIFVDSNTICLSPTAQLICQCGAGFDCLVPLLLGIFFTLLLVRHWFGYLWCSSGLIPECDTWRNSASWLVASLSAIHAFGSSLSLALVSKVCLFLGRVLLSCTFVMITIENDPSYKHQI